MAMFDIENAGRYTPKEIFQTAGFTQLSAIVYSGIIMFDSLDQIFNKIPEHFLAKNAEGVEAQIQFDFEGEKGGKWFVIIADQKLEVERGSTASPDINIMADAQVSLDIANGKINPFVAYMRGSFRFTGEKTKLFELQNLFQLPEEMAWLKRLA